MTLHGIDVDLLKAINLNRNTALDFLFIIITNSASLLAYGIPVIIFGIGIVKKDIEAQRNGLYIIVSVALATLIASALKYGIARQRPFELLPFIQNVAEGGSPSFPSGHTCDAFTFAIAVSCFYPKWYVVLPSLLWAFAVGYSRVDLGVHYPSDVAAGMIIGSFIAYLCFKINNRFLKRKTSNHV